MTAAGGGHLAIDVAIGILVLVAYRYARREAPPVAALMAFGIIARTAIGVTLFWMSYLDLPFLRPWHSRDGFWVLAPDARSYYQAALTLAERQVPQNTVTRASPAFVTALSGWMHLVGWSPASGLFLNLILYVVLCVLVVRACRPFDRTARVASAACLVPFSVAPILLAHGSQPLKDDVCAFLSAVMCLSVLALLRVRGDIDRRPPNRWMGLGALVSLGVAAYIVSGIRLYFTAFVCACLVPAAVVYVWRSRSAWPRWSVTVALATLAAASVGPVWARTPEIRRWIGARPALAEIHEVEPHVATTAPDRVGAVAPERAARAAAGQASSGPLAIWEFALGKLRRARLDFVRTGGATNVVAAGEIDGGIVRPALVGLATVFVPISIVKELGWVDFSGGRGLLWITDVDTVALDFFILAGVALVVLHRDRIGSNLPYVWFVVALGCLICVPLGFIVTNFGTLVRLRLMAMVPMWMLPLAVSRPSTLTERR